MVVSGDTAGDGSEGAEDEETGEQQGGQSQAPDNSLSGEEVGGEAQTVALLHRAVDRVVLLARQWVGVAVEQLPPVVDSPAEAGVLADVEC